MSVWMKNWKAPWNRERGHFSPAVMTESALALENPARGWYQIYTFQAEVMFQPEETRWCLQEGENLAFVLVDIGAYQKKPLDDAGVENVQNIIKWFQGQGKDVILRVVYDREGKGMEREPASFALVKTHMEQIANVLNTLESSVFLYQGLLVGSWGEMHGSRYLVQEKLAQLETILQREAGACFHAVRSPMLWRWLRAEGMSVDKLGIFDDGILGSETNLGTFGYEERSADGWLRSWCKEDEFTFLDEVCKHVPCGGEAILSTEDGCIIEGTDNVSRRRVLKEQVALLKRMHVTYLNRIHDRNMIELWRAWDWESEDIWNGSSTYDYIGNHLGYRFVIRDVRMIPEKKTHAGYVLSIEVENVGFSNLYQETELLLEWQTLDGQTQKEKIVFDLRTVESGSKRMIVHKIVAQAGTMYLQAKRKIDGKVIYFANVTEHREKVLLGTFTS